MREIKFRAWFKKLNQMWYDGFGGDTEDLNKLIKEFQDKQVLMQYTGLKDANGVEIYEGDIVKDYEDENHMQIKFGSYDNGYSYDDAVSGCGFYGYYDDKWLDDLSDVSEFEVIGNIYENKELLEQ